MSQTIPTEFTAFSTDRKVHVCAVLDDQPFLRGDPRLVYKLLPNKELSTLLPSGALEGLDKVRLTGAAAQAAVSTLCSIAADLRDGLQELHDRTVSAVNEVLTTYAVGEDCGEVKQP